MNELVTAIITGIVAFAATNIDDIVILLLFFSQVNTTFQPHQIVAGQYLGFTVLVILSLPGFFGQLIIPQHWIGLLGLIPMSIGISSLVNWEESSVEEFIAETPQSETPIIASFFSPQTYSVAAITIANGSDNISIYIPLFASCNLESLLVIISLFFILLGIWCYAAYKLMHHKKIADILANYGNNLVPFILMGLGASIVLKSGALSLIQLVASCLCLVVLLKNNDSANEVEEDSSK